MGAGARQPLAGGVFVGRGQEFRLLAAGLESAQAGRGGLFLLRGEAGIGKTRLAERLSDRADELGIETLWGQSTQAEGAPPYWPWLQVLRTLVRSRGAAELAQLAGPGLALIIQVIPELRAQFSGSEPVDPDSIGSRFGAYDAVSRLLVEAAAAKPAVIVLEDLHWADSPSLLLLQILATGLRRSRLMVIGTYRDLELPPAHPLRTQLAEFIRGGETVEIPLTGLGEAESGGLIRSLTDFEPAPELLKRLQDQTDGSPFFLKELARALVREPKPVHDPDHPPIPEGVRAVLKRRLDELSPDCRTVLEVAAVAGHAVDPQTLAAVVQTAGPALLDVLDEAVAAGVLRRQSGATSFSHGLFRDALYDGLSSLRQGELHGLLAQTLESRAATSGRVSSAQLAHHFGAAARVDVSLRRLALAYETAAGKEALAELAYEEAAGHFQRATGFSDDEAQFPELLIELGRSRYLAGDVEGAIEAAREAARLAAGDAHLLARAALVVRGVGGPGTNNALRELCELALRYPVQDLSLRVQLLSQVTVVLMQSTGPGDEAAAAEYSRQALELARDAADPDTVFAAIHAREMAMSGPEGVEERIQLGDRCLELSVQSGRPALAQWGHQWRVEGLVQLGRLSEAEAELELQARLADQLREPLFRWRTTVAQSWMAILRGRFDDARRLMLEARQLGRRGHDSAGQFNYLMTAIPLARMVGGLEAVVAEATDILYQHPELRRPVVMGLGNAGASDPALLAEASQMVREMRELGSAEIRPRMAWLPAMAALAEAASGQGDRNFAELLYIALLPYARYAVVSTTLVGAVGPVHHFLGILAGSLGRLESAAAHLEAAVEFEARAGMPALAATSRIHWAAILLHRGEDGDFSRARGLAQAGLAASLELGMEPWRATAIDLLAELKLKRPKPHPLSPRELEVASLVAQGLSNRALAERLHLSERTAESHVKNICDKLGFHSRSQVAAWVAGLAAESGAG